MRYLSAKGCPRQLSRLFSTIARFQKDSKGDIYIYILISRGVPKIAISRGAPRISKSVFEYDN